MSSGYTAELNRLSSEEPNVPVRKLRLGMSMRIVAQGEYNGVVGTLVKRGGTRYHLRIDAGVVTVPFTLAELVSVS